MLFKGNIHAGFDYLFVDWGFSVQKEPGIENIPVCSGTSVQQGTQFMSEHVGFNHDLNIESQKIFYGD